MKSASPIKSTRNIRPQTKLILFVRAGGRCEFNGCNHYLLEHYLTHKDGNFADIAHIVAFSEVGPRGGYDPRPIDINNVDNLMLLCHECHDLIDRHSADYTVLTLKEYKREHEDRIFHVTGLGPDLMTTVVQLKAKIGEAPVAIPVAQVTQAVAPRYPSDKRGWVIDLTSIGGNDQAYYQTACKKIKQEVDRLYDSGMDVEITRHISLFALAPIPLLIYLGNRLNNKIPVELYQRHRDTEDWVWKEGGELVEYSFSQLSPGTDKSKVALLLSLSGRIHKAHLPEIIDDTFYVYELTVANVLPNPNFLRLKQDLINFKSVYQNALRQILGEHGVLEEIHLFPAVPAPVAVTCGRELLPKVDPTLVIYDYDKAEDGYIFTLRINEP